MKEYKLKTTNGEVSLHLPLYMEEISPEYLEAVTSHITVSKGYVLIAVVYREQLFMVLNSAKNNKALTASVVPLFVKGNSDRDFVNNCKAGTKLVITGANIARGIHVGVPYNSLNIDNVVRLCSADKSIYSTALSEKEYCYFVEFKIVPDYDVVASISEAKPIIDPFVQVANNAKA